MDWAGRMNRVMDYVEENLSEPLRGEEISRIAACAFATFQASFAQVAGIPFSEYVRRRRLTLAAYDLQNTDESVLDIALKYGYSSADAFRVAFRRLHGAAPTQVRAPGTPLTFYCKLTFELTVRGIEQMEYAILEKGPFRVMGVRRTTPYGGGTWAVVKADGSGERVRAVSGRFFDLGLCFGFGPDGSNDYMCAVEWAGEAQPGFEIYDYPAATWLRFSARGRISAGTLGEVWRRVNGEFLPQSRYEKSGFATIERYVTWDEAADMCDVEILIPVREKDLEKKPCGKG